MPMSATTSLKTVFFYHLGVMYIDNGNVTADYAIQPAISTAGKSQQQSVTLCMTMF